MKAVNKQTLIWQNAIQTAHCDIYIKSAIFAQTNSAAVWEVNGSFSCWDSSNYLWFSWLLVNKCTSSMFLKNIMDACVLKSSLKINWHFFHVAFRQISLVHEKVQLNLLLINAEQCCKYRIEIWLSFYGYCVRTQFAFLQSSRMYLVHHESELSRSVQDDEQRYE